MKLPADLPREKLLLLVAGTCLGLLILDFLVISPFLAGWRTRADKIDLLRTNLTTGASLIDQEDRWQRYGVDMTSRLLPTTASAAEGVLLRQVDTWAKGTGLRVTSLRPRAKEDAAGQPLLELQITGAGSMDAVVRFLYNLETSTTAVAVDNLELTPSRAEPDLDLNLRITGLCLATKTSARSSR